VATGRPDGPGTRPSARRRTLEVYEERAGEWHGRRDARPGPARRFARWLADDPEAPRVRGPVVDLGCGPGWHLGALGGAGVGPVLGLDGAAAMLRLARGQDPGTPLVQAELDALPFRRGSLGAVWASRSLVHLPRGDVPMALWDLHRCLAVGGVARLVLFGGDDELGELPGDDFPGRWFSRWTEELLADVVVGAGFAVEELTAGDGSAEVPHLTVTVRRLRTLADTVGTGMRLLLVGLNPSLHAADAGVGFAGPSNRGWPALVAAGLASVPRDPRRLLVHDGIGMTDLAKRATARAAEIAPEEFAAGVARLDRLCAWLRPAAVCVVGLTGWRQAVDRGARPGAQDRALGGRPVWLMPNPSGLNTHTSLRELADHLIAAAALGTRR